MHHHHVLGAQHFVHRFFLCGVEPGETYRVEGEAACGLPAVEQVAQIGQAVALGTDGAVERLEHQAVAGLVEKQLYACLVGLCQGENVGSVGQGDHHAVAVDKAHGARGVEIVYFVFATICLGDGEEAYGTPELKVVFNLLVGCACHLNSHLVE